MYDKKVALEHLLKSYEAWFDVERDFEFAGERFDAYARYAAHGEQYVLVKRAKLWEVDTCEHVFFRMAERFEEGECTRLVDFMRTQALALVNPKPNHMSTALSLIVLADEVTLGAARLVRATRFRKSYLLGLRGWADVRLAVADCAAAKVFTNPAGRDLAKLILP